MRVGVFFTCVFRHRIWIISSSAEHQRFSALDCRLVLLIWPCSFCVEQLLTVALQFRSPLKPCKNCIRVRCEQLFMSHIRALVYFCHCRIVFASGSAQSTLKSFKSKPLPTFCTFFKRGRTSFWLHGPRLRRTTQCAREMHWSCGINRKFSGW